MTTLSQKLNLKSDTVVYAAAIAIALIVASALLVVYFVALTPKQEKYTTIYLLDANKKAADYPEYLVAGVNSTFSVYVDVENHLGRDLENFEVLVKVTKDLNPTFPVNTSANQTITGALQDGGKTESIVTLTLKEPGNYGVYFELWVPSESGQLQFSNNFAVLNVKVSPA